MMETHQKIEGGFDALDRPLWDTWFMSLCFLVAQRSLDPSTKHGCIVVDDDHTILAVGYNGPPRGCRDDQIPLTRDKKYAYMIHSESSAILNAARCGISLKGSTFYISGYPCEKCVREIISVGARRVVYGPVRSHCVDEESTEITKTMLFGQKIQFARFVGEQQIHSLLESTLNYFRSKVVVHV